ncbi:GGDEF domain-containing protein [Paraburkholderia sp. A2WS-5]|uniref:diguanylate cyclase domain-containing protein n=1 Tax=unclassified Paraburkholderia TaxID=2615204 RepID=UPI003B7B5180
MSEAYSHFWPGQGFLGAFQKNPEKEQAVLRVSLGGLVFLAYLAAASVYRTKNIYETTALVALYVAYGGVTYIAATVAPGRSRRRLTLTTFADQSLLIALLAVGGQATLPLLWVVFWFLVGAGCRYGQRMLGLSCAVALTGIAGLMHWQPWWHANFTAGLGVALSLAATSIYLAVLVRRLEKQAATDPLTGLSNRVQLEHAIGRTLALRSPEASQAALLLIDLDGFKEVNDAHGHAVGDELLRRFAAALASCVRRGDTLARLGGDEFVVLAHQIPSKANALSIATRIHAILGAMRTVAGHPVAVSGSIGVCMLAQEAGASPLAPLTARALMRAADGAMYRAKSRGSGQTVFAETDEMRAVA